MKTHEVFLSLSRYSQTKASRILFALNFNKLEMTFQCKIFNNKLDNKAWLIHI